MSGRLCQRMGCNETKTRKAHLSLNYRAYEIYLCEKHAKELELLQKKRR